MFRQRRHHGHHRQANFALYLLAAQLFQVGFDRIPPVTLFSILGQVAIFLRLIPLKQAWPPIKSICISSQSVLYGLELKRLVFAPFFHLDDWHLYYNMVSFLWKGIHLERELGSPYFAYLIAVFSVLTSAVTAGLGMAAAEFTGNQYYVHQCAAGFSGVIFALKVLTTYNSHGSHLVMGIIPVPGPYICWAELFLIQVITPNVSFIGHLAGIIVGLLYVKGPLKSIMTSVVPTQPSYTYTRSNTTTYGSAGPQPPRQSQGSFWPFNDEATGYRRQPSYTYTSGSSGRNSYEESGYNGNTGRPEQHQEDRYGSQTDYQREPSNTYTRRTPGTKSSRSFQSHHHYIYTGGLSEEEQLERAMEESRSTSNSAGRSQPTAPPFPPDRAPPSYEEATGGRDNLYPDLPPDPNEELRRRRLARFT